MSEISGFDWWFRDRDYVLRENLEALEASNAASASRSARLSSQLSTLQGSLEHRLNALSAAFDAYVRLGDIREQLAAYAEAATIRREAMAAISALGDGGPAAPVDDRGTGYWVAAATNALIARVSGSPDSAAEAAVRSKEPDAALFLVAASGALGHGAELENEVAAMLRSDDGRLDDHQLQLWQAVVRGDFGPHVIRTVLIDWKDQLAQQPEVDWWNWAAALGSKVGRETLDWIEEQARGSVGDLDHPAASPAAAQEVADDQGPTTGGLRGLVLELINSGFGDERQLLATARELRARIEHPGSVVPADDDPAPSRTSIVDAVRASYAGLQPSPARTEVFAALAPLLAAAVEKQAPGLLSEEPAVVPVRIAGVSIDVTPEGPDQRALATATTAAGRWADPSAGKGRLYGYGIATVACAVIALVLAIAGVSVFLVVLLLIAAVIAGALTVRTVLAGRREDERRRQEAADRERSIAEAVEKAARMRTTQRDLVQRTADQLDRVRTLLSDASAPDQQASAPLVHEQTAGLIM